MLIPLRDAVVRRVALLYFVFFFNDTATTEIYTLSLHDALPISSRRRRRRSAARPSKPGSSATGCRSEEHTSELQSPCNLVCRLLLEKKKTPRPPSAPVALQQKSFRRALLAPTSSRVAFYPGPPF